MGYLELTLEILTWISILLIMLSKNLELFVWIMISFSSYIAESLLIVKILQTRQESILHAG
jgi:hypothetical protein